MRVFGAVVALALVLVACSTGSHDGGKDVRDVELPPNNDLRSDDRPVDSRSDTPALSDTPDVAEVSDIGDSTESELFDERGENDSAPEVDACTPDCDDKQCGSDGCDGICGECTGPQDECIEYACICLPACAEKQCGEDGCGGQCGQCEEGGKCVDGNCEDVPVVEDLIIIHGDSAVEPRDAVVDTAGNVLMAAVAWGSEGHVSDTSFTVMETELGVFIMKFDQLSSHCGGNQPGRVHQDPWTMRCSAPARRRHLWSQSTSTSTTQWT